MIVLKSLIFVVEHVDDVRAIVQRAVKDLSIEQSLKTYEEVWLSKIFETREHVRFQPTPNVTTNGAPEQVRRLICPYLGPLTGVPSVTC